MPLFGNFFPFSFRGTFLCEFKYWPDTEAGGLF